MKYWKQALFYVFSAISVTITLAWLNAQIRLIFATHQTPTPQIALVLGGRAERERFAAHLARQQPMLDVWISTGRPRCTLEEIFKLEDVSLSRLHTDYQATDTVTNFTTMVSKLKVQDVKHLYLVTSAFHMPRSEAIAFWVLGSHGIAYTPITVDDEYKISEPQHKIWRDVMRSWLWLLTGRSSSSLDPNPPIRRNPGTGEELEKLNKKAQS